MLSERLVRIYRLLGRECEVHGMSCTIRGSHTAGAICQGGAPKTYAFADANEDCVLLAEGTKGVVLAIADAHGGAMASEIAVDWLAGDCARTWTCSEINEADWPQEAATAFASISAAILQKNECCGQHSQTTLVVGVLNPEQNVALFASVGDSLAFLVGRPWATSALGEPQPSDYFLGTRGQSPGTVKAHSIIRSCSLDGVAAIVLASDGISTPGIGFDDPAAALCRIAQEANGHALPGEMAAHFATGILESARQTQEKNKCGDNIAVAVYSVANL